jgi:hypothetical protein
MDTRNAREHERSTFVVALAMVLLGLGDGHAQSSLDPGCAAPEHRQFDFWEGAWTVTDSAGTVLGTNDVTRIAGGCGLQEHWRGVRGGEGMSLNVWQPSLERWTQFWVGTGAVLFLTGGVDEEGRIVLQGERQMPEGPVLDRIIWTPLPEGEVRQQWETSADGGLTWQRTFTGLYRRRDTPPDRQASFMRSSTRPSRARSAPGRFCPA